MPIDTSVELTDLDLTPVSIAAAPTKPETTPVALTETREVPHPALNDRSDFYASLTAQQAANLRAATNRIVAARGLIGKNMLLIGRELIQISGEMPGHFEDWLRLEFAMSRASAYHYMNVAAEFADVPEVVELLPATTVYKLAAKATPARVREAVVREIIAGETISAEEVEGRIAEARTKVAEEKRIESKRRKQSHPPAANDDAATKESGASHLGREEADPAFGLDDKRESQGSDCDEHKRVEQMVYETSVSLRQSLPASALDALVACATSEASWNALRGILVCNVNLNIAA